MPGAFPQSFVDEFDITEAARAKDYAKAALLMADFYDHYEMQDMDEFFLRNCVITALQAGEADLADVIYKNAIQMNDRFFAVEKRLMEREIQKLRKTLAAKR